MSDRLRKYAAKMGMLAGMPFCLFQDDFCQAWLPGMKEPIEANPTAVVLEFKGEIRVERFITGRVIDIFARVCAITTQMRQVAEITQHGDEWALRHEKCVGREFGAYHGDPTAPATLYMLADIPADILEIRLNVL